MGGVVESVVRDLRYALRSVWRRPVFAMVAVLTVALGIGATTTIFSVVDGVLLSPLPYPEADGLIRVSADYDGETGSMSLPDTRDIEARVDAIESLVGVATATRTLTGLGDPTVLRVARVTRGLLEPFGMAPHLGRDIAARDYGPDGPRIAVLRHGFWQQRFGGDPGVLGRTVELNGILHEVVGVAPPAFDWPNDVDVWVPRRSGPETGCGRGCHNLQVYGRIAPGATVDLAQAEVDALAVNLAAAWPESNTGKGFRVESLRDSVVGDVRAGLRILMGAVGLVLLIACVNVANLLLVRGSTRAVELSVRSALGASRRRLLAQSLAESAVLASLGGVLGLALTAAALALLPRLAGDAIPRLEIVTVDLRVLGFCLLAVVTVTLLFGLAPAWLTTRGASAPKPRNTRGGMGPAQSRARSWLLTAEVALSVALLIGAGLLVRSFQEMVDVDLGYATADIHRFTLVLPTTRYPTAADGSRLYREVEDRLRTLPGVEAVGTMWSPPLAGGNAYGTITVEGRPPVSVENEVEANVRPIGPGALETIGVTPVRGRGFTRDDHDGSAEPVAMINERLARTLFPDEDPIGRVVTYGVSLGYDPPNRWRIVGIMPDLRFRTVTGEPAPELWVPHGVYGPASATVLIRMAAGAASPIPEAREVVSAIDPNLPVFRVGTVEESRASQVAGTRFYMILTAAFAGLAASLAAVGLYGVVAFAVSRRTREIGLRVALGADRDGVIRLVVAQGMRPAFWGLILGIAGASIGTRALESVIFGVAALDPLTFAGSAVLLAGVALLATLVPALRATRIDPVEALRAE
jgi:predicted permease